MVGVLFMPSPKPSPLIWIVLIEYNDQTTWKHAIQILESAGISPIYEGSLGWLEICVPRDDSEMALTLLKSDARLAGKRVRWFR